MSINIEAMELTHTGYLRLGYQHVKEPHGKTDDTAIGGKLNIQLQHTKLFALGASFYTVHSLSTTHNTGVPFYGSEDEGYTLLGEAYLRLQYSKTHITLGRQSFDSPYANVDDIGMISNTFEGATLHSKEIPHTKIVLAYLNQWSGVDSDTPEDFTKLNADDGIWVAGGVYSGLPHTQLKAWFYTLPNYAKLIYLEANHNLTLGDTVLAFTGQYSVQDYDNGERSSIYGASIEASIEPWGLSTIIAYNAVDGVASDNFFGGGPFLSSSEHITIPDGGDDAKAWRVGGALDVATIEGLSVGINYLSIQRIAQERLNELDIVLGYSTSETWSLQLIYSDIQDKSPHDESFSDIRFFVNYNF